MKGEKLMENDTFKKQRLFVDMDGTLAIFKHLDTMEPLYEKGYFLNLEPMKNVVDGIHNIIRDYPKIDVYVLSAVLSDSKYALQEKNEWLDKHLPQLPVEKRIFSRCGNDKKNYVKGGVHSNDILLDDYTKNLLEWKPGKGIKLLNGINHTNKTWRGTCISAELSGDILASELAHQMERLLKIQEQVRRGSHLSR